MSRITFGSRELQKALQKYGDSIIDEVKRIVSETAYLIQANARALAAEDSGDLKKSIEVEIKDGGFTAVVTVGQNYAVWIEFGTGIYSTKGTGRKDPWVYYSDKLNRFVFTRGMPAQPFWFPAVDAGKRYYKKEMKKLGG